MTVFFAIFDDMNKRPTANAERKLDAAKFFLEHLEQNHDDARAVYHYASGILNAARSVDYALRHECGDHFKTWLNEWLERLPVEERAYCENLIRLRGEDVHGEGVPLSVVIDVATTNAEAVIAGRFSGTGIKSADAADFWEDLRQVSSPPPDTVMDVMYEIRGLGPRFVGYTGEDVVVACRRFIGLAERMLREFRQTLNQ